MLPDYLAPGLTIVFIGINPGSYSDRVGHYFARRTNLFWHALYAARLVPEPLGPADDVRLTEFGYGLTDLVARPTANVDGLAAHEFVQGAKLLRAKIENFAPRIACFVGLVGYRRAFHAHAVPGEQSSRWGTTQLYIVPSTSPRNVYYRPRIIEWFERLRACRDEMDQAKTKDLIPGRPRGAPL
jgi:TDG/mug DNA glycosylase family protein